MRRRRRSLVLVPAALLSAACARTRKDDTAAEDALSRDLTLATQMENKPVDPARPEAGPAGVCAAQPVPAAPTAQQRQQALSIAQRAQQAEVVGDTRAARELFARAAQLDGTDKDVVYHLARADEALGRTGDAAREYCQYLALVPGTAGAAEANARLAALGKPSAPNASTPRVAATSSWRSPARTARVSYATPSAASVTSGAAAPSSTGPALGTVAVEPRSQQSTTTTGEAAGHRASTTPTAEGTGAATSVASADTASASAAASPTTATAAPTRRPSTRTAPSHTARDATIGAAAGAAVGAVMTHSVKGAGIGAIAGGLLGAVAGHGGSGLVQTPGFAR